MNDAGAASDLGLRTTDGILARRHPWAVFGLWAWESALAVLVAWPAASLAGAAYGTAPMGDGAFWVPGGHFVMDFVVRNGAGLRAVTAAAIAVVAGAAILGLVPMAATLCALTYATRDRHDIGLARAVGEGIVAWRPMIVLLVMASVVQGLVVAAGAAAGSAVESWAHGPAGEVRAQEMQGAVLLVFCAAASSVGVAHDLARAAVVRFRVRGLRAARLGLRVLSGAPLALWWSWAWRAGAGLLPVAAGIWVTGRMGGQPGAALLAVFVLHQAVIASRVALRTSWLALALRALDGGVRRSD